MPPPSPEDAAGLFRLLMDNVREYAVFVLDPDGRVIEWNAGAERVLGYTAEEAVGMDADAIYTDEDRAGGVPERERAEAAQTGNALDNRWHVRKGGERFWANGVLTALRHPPGPREGELRGFAKILRDNTARKEAEDALRCAVDRADRQLQTFGAALGAFEDFVYVLTPDVRFTYANRALLDLWGRELSDVVGRGFAELGYPDHLVALHRSQVDEVVRTRGPVRGGNALAGADGEERHYEYIFSPVLGPDGAVVAVAGITRDVTERMRQEADAAFRDKLAERIRGIGDPLEVQGAAARLLGEHLGAIRAHYAEVEPDEEHVVVARDYERAGPNRAGRYRMADFPTFYTEFRAGRTVVVEDVAVDGRLTEGERGALGALPTAALVIVPLVKGDRFVALLAAHHGPPHVWTDAEVALVEETAERTWSAVERARAEAALRESEGRYRTLFESIDEGFCVLEMIYDEAGAPVDYRFLEANPAFERHTGLAGAVGRTAREMVQNLESHWVETYDRVARTGEPFRFEQGSEAMGRWFDVHAAPVGGPESRRVALLFTDVTERKRAEAALRESEAQFRAAADLVPDLLWRAGPFGDRVWGNRRWTEYTGQSAEEAAGFGWAETVHPDDRDRALREATGAAGPFRGEHRLRRADGAYRWFLVNAAPVLGDDGRVTGWFGSSTDVHLERTARETLEARVEERTAQVRELARALTLAEQAERRRIAYVLHDDLQQRLYGLELTLSLLRRRPGGEDAERLHEQAERTLAGATALTRSLSHEMAPPLLRGDDLEVLLEWVADRKRDLYGLEVDVEVRDGVMAPDEAVRTLLYQLVQELLFNVAKHAGTDRARVVAERAGEEVRVTVEDEGAGFDLGALEGGTGLGLPSVRERLELVGGRLAVDSAPGIGTRVTLTVPRDGPRASSSQPAGTNEPPPSSREP